MRNNQEEQRPETVYVASMLTVNSLSVQVSGRRREDVESFMARIDHEGASEWEVEEGTLVALETTAAETRLLTTAGARTVYEMLREQPDSGSEISTYSSQRGRGEAALDHYRRLLWASGED